MKRVVVIGGGFGGLAVAKGLWREDVQVVLIDRRNFHLFQPLLYQVATAALSPADIAEPIRHILSRYPRVEVRLGEAKAVDVAGRVVELVDGERIPYDWLVVAAGATHSYFGHDAWAPHAPGLKTIGDALDLRRRLLLAFEKAEWCTDEAERKRLTTFCVVGGGPTGVETAGAIREIATTTLLQDFRHIQTDRTRVVLVEAQDALLAGYPDDLRASARRQLEDLGVEVRTGAMVTDVDARGLQIGTERIDAETVIWAAGVKGESIGASLGAELDRAGRVKVLPDLSIADHPEIFVIGDLASFEQDGKVLPGVAQVAMQMGAVAIANVRADIAGKPRGVFHYRDLGKMATIGRRRAVAHLPFVKFSGFIAWSLWAFIHLALLIAFRNRIVVFWKWMVSYFLADRGSRLVWQDEGWSVKRLEGPSKA